MRNYMYILVMAVTTYLIRVVPITLMRKEIKNRTFPFLFDLCAICDTGCDDISGDFKHHGLTLDLLGGISGGHGAGVLPVQFICGVIGELYSGVCAAVVIIHNYKSRNRETVLNGGAAWNYIS